MCFIFRFYSKTYALYFIRTVSNCVFNPTSIPISFGVIFFISPCLLSFCHFWLYLFEVFLSHSLLSVICFFLPICFPVVLILSCTLSVHLLLNFKRRFSLRVFRIVQFLPLFYYLCAVHISSIQYVYF